MSAICAVSVASQPNYVPLFEGAAFLLRTLSSVAAKYIGSTSVMHLTTQRDLHEAQLYTRSTEETGHFIPHCVR
jgi:hypothetical protein